MATRQAKYGGLTTYAAELAAGFPLIKASEVDSDLEQLYTNITNGNVAAGAAIAYSKLNLTNQLLTADLTDNIITTPKILDSAVSTAKLAALAVTTAKITAGASIVQFQIGDDSSTSVLTNNTSTLVVEFVITAPRAITSTVFLFATFAAKITGTGTTAGTNEMIFDIRHSGTAGVADGTVIDSITPTWDPRDNAQSGWTVTTIFPVYIARFGSITGNTVTRYKLILKSQNNGGSSLLVRQASQLFAVELA